MGSGITDWGSGIISHGIGISRFLETRDQAVPFLLDQNVVTCLESRIRDFRNEISDEKKTYLILRPCILRRFQTARNDHRSSHLYKVLLYIVNIKCVSPRRLFRNLRLKSKYFVNHLATTLFIEDEFNIVKKSLASLPR